MKLWNWPASAIDNGELVSLANGMMVRIRELRRFKNIFAAIVTEAFQHRTDRQSIQLREILHQCNPPCHESLAHLIMKNFTMEGKWIKEKGGIRPAGFEQRIPDELAGVAEVLRIYAHDQGLHPFSAEYFVKSATDDITLWQVRKTLDYFCKTGEIIRLNNDRYLTPRAIERIKEKVSEWVDEKGEICLRDCKDALDFNRGLGLPVLEHLDQIGFTVKQGEGRILTW